jgi:rare lipoprotein A
MTKIRAARFVAALASASFAAGCSSNPPQDGPPRTGSNTVIGLPDDPIPMPEDRSRYGNGPIYEVFGTRYTVMPSAIGYKEKGVASWYGKKFHGRLTSNREVYDMHQMTAAHKTLPLPTYVRVRNLSNNRSIVVRVNDRGPFAHNRIIDLSYAAAQKLDMVVAGTSLVEVEAITFQAANSDLPATSVTPPPTEPRPPTAADPVVTDPNHIYVQIGAFGSKANADRRLQLLRSGGLGAAAVHTDTNVNPPLYRVRMGPIQGVEEYDLLVQELSSLGIVDPIIVTE